jgi:hypothetical protein
MKTVVAANPIDAMAVKYNRNVYGCGVLITSRARNPVPICIAGMTAGTRAIRAHP